MANKFNIILGGSFDEKSLGLMKTQAENYFKKYPIKLSISLDSNIKAIQEEIQKTTELAGKKIINSGQQTDKGTLVKSSLKGTDQTDVYKKIGVEYDEKLIYLNNQLIKTELDYASAVKRTAQEKEAIEKQNEKATQQAIANQEKLEKQNEKTAQQALKDTERQTSSNVKLANDINRVGERVKNLGNDHLISKNKAKEYNDELNKIKSLPIDKQTNAIKNLNQKISDGKKQAMGFGEQLKIAFSKFAIWSVATVTWYGVINMLKKVVQEVIVLDKAFTNLQMVTQSTDTEMANLKRSYIGLAKEMGVTLAAVTTGADEFLRAGLNARDAIDALRASTVLSTVANMDSGESTQNLIAIMNAYGLKANELLSIVDKMSAVDIKAATSSQELGEALRVSASSAQLSGISFDKYIGMIATVSETTRQSASTIGQSFDEYRRFSVA